MNSTAKFT